MDHAPIRSFLCFISIPYRRSLPQRSCCYSAENSLQTVPFLKKYTIPEPVAGGLLVALALLALKKSMDIEIDFDMSLKDPLMLAFFATIGLNANLASLRAGGRCWALS